MALALTSTIFDITLPFEIQTWPFFVLLFVDFIRVSILADRRRHPNAKVPVNTLIAMAVCIVVFFAVSILFGMLAYNFNSPQSTSEYFLVVLGILALIFVLSIPVGLSLSLVKEYTRTHRSLLKKITEIEELSARNLAQEQEKQHLLSTQNELLEKQVATRTSELKKSLQSLKATQAQLVQSEKLASLGELTAGIAHEIQNPLNFVNNFSEVSTELIDEMKEELERGDTEEVKAIAGDLRQNLQKIVHHGKRASSIVKGMLEHSRTGTGERQLTDINALCDEYLRLSYHGMRAKDKSFNADFELITEPNLPQINVVSQDIGRVLLNLINNAFYAVNVARASSPSFKPKVSVLTEKSDNQLIIKVKDNGLGMSDKVKAKVFQPFFTTKPTGQGTGLGLSLAYDIITKGHGGKIEVESEEGNGTTFTIRLPLVTAPIAVS
ncbi:GHKL domain-containing protein [Runella sp. SP2]|nr:GHKL domain-containing protein [Runella sp. SP2]